MDTGIEPLADYVKQILMYYRDEIGDAQHEMEILSSDLELLNSIVKDAIIKYEKDLIFEHWGNNIMGVSNEIEGTIGTWIRQIVVRKSQNQRILLDHRMAEEIKSLRKTKLPRLLNKNFGYFTMATTADASGSETTEIEVEAWMRYMMDDGLNEKVDETISYLIHEPEKFQVVYITGLLCTGKTTLARKVYHHPSIKHEFPNRIWVDVGQRSNTKNYVLLSILRGLTQEDHFEKSCDELVRIVHEYIKVAKLFIVLDDVSTDEQWNEIMEIISDGDLMIKVLITTARQESMWYATCHEMIRLKPLNQDRWCWHLRLCYDALPYDLRICFLYLGIFPKDFEIPVWKLTQLWIAEGFIRKEAGMSLDEIAKHNVMKLINRNLLVADKVNFTGEVKTCRVNSIVRDFCNENILVKHLHLFNEVRFESSMPIRWCRRRLYIHNYVLNFLRKRPRVKMIHSFLCFSKEPFVMEYNDISNFTDDFGFVRVLEATAVNFRTFPHQFTQLVLLRYLTLSGDEITVLPESISNLWNLRTLVVNTSSRTLEINDIIWKMMKLKHLKTKASIVLKEGMGKGGKHIHTLTKLLPKSFTLDVSNKVKNLKKLGFRGNLSCLSNLQNLDCLEKLTLKHDENPKNLLNGLPQSYNFPPRVKILVLSGTYLPWKDLSTLGGIGTLEVVKLKDNAFVGNAWDTNESGFKRLEALSIEHTNLKYWTASTNSFPELINLELKCCKKLLDVPFELGKKLETLSMSNVTKFAVSCARKIEADRANRGAFNLRIDA